MTKISANNTRLTIAGITDIGGKAPGIAAKETKFPIIAKIFVEILGKLFGQRYSVVTINHKSYLVSRDSLTRFIDAHKPLMNSILDSYQFSTGNTKQIVNSMKGIDIERLFNKLSTAGQGGAKLLEKEVLSEKNKIEFSKITTMSTHEEALGAINEMLNLAQIAGFKVSEFDPKKYIKNNKEVNFGQLQKDLSKTHLSAEWTNEMEFLPVGPKHFVLALRDSWMNDQEKTMRDLCKEVGTKKSLQWNDDNHIIAGTKEQINKMLEGVLKRILGKDPKNLSEGDAENVIRRILDHLGLKKTKDKEVVALNFWDVRNAFSKEDSFFYSAMYGEPTDIREVSLKESFADDSLRKELAQISK